MIEIYSRSLSSSRGSISRSFCQRLDGWFSVPLVTTRSFLFFSHKISRRGGGLVFFLLDQVDDLPLHDFDRRSLKEVPFFPSTEASSLFSLLRDAIEERTFETESPSRGSAFFSFLDLVCR